MTISTATSLHSLPPATTTNSAWSMCPTATKCFTTGARRCESGSGVRDGAHIADANSPTHSGWNGAEDYSDPASPEYVGVRAREAHVALPPPPTHPPPPRRHTLHSTPTPAPSRRYDPDLEVVLYYSDFYGFKTANLPAAWRYHNLFLTSVHPEADNCTSTQDSDCPPDGTIPHDNILQNRAWLASHINQVAQTNW